MTAAGWAHVVLVVHFAYAAFVVLMIPLVLLGWSRGWRLARSDCLRAAHLLAVIPVLLELVLSASCPLTMLGDRLRARAGEAAYGGCIHFWLQRLVGHAVPGSIVTAFAVALVAGVPWLYWARPPDWLIARRRLRPPRRKGA